MTGDDKSVKRPLSAAIIIYRTKKPCAGGSRKNNTDNKFVITLLSNANAVACDRTKIRYDNAIKV